MRCSSCSFSFLSPSRRLNRRGGGGGGGGYRPPPETRRHRHQRRTPTPTPTKCCCPEDFFETFFLLLFFCRGKTRPLELSRHKKKRKKEKEKDPRSKARRRRHLNMVRGPKKHLKRLNAPKSWMLDKLTGVFAPKPAPGASRAIAFVFFLPSISTHFTRNTTR